MRLTPYLVITIFGLLAAIAVGHYAVGEINQAFGGLTAAMQP